MSVQSQIDRINENVSNTYSVLEGYGAEMPQTRNTANLPQTAADIKAVLYKEQTLTDEQKAQARANIGAASAGVVGNGVLCVQVNKKPDNSITSSHTYAEIVAAYSSGMEIICHYSDIDNTASLQLIQANAGKCTFVGFILNVTFLGRIPMERITIEINSSNEITLEVAWNDRAIHDGNDILDPEYPSQFINDCIFYHAYDVIAMYGTDIIYDWETYTVKNLPEVGEACWDGQKTVAYFSISDFNIFGYVDSNLSSTLGLSVGWHSAGTIIPVLGYPYGGIILSLAEAAPDKINVYVRNRLFTCKDDILTEIVQMNDIPLILAEAKKSGEFDVYTPVRGTDYWTDSDIAEIKSYVDDAILGGAW